MNKEDDRLLTLEQIIKAKSEAVAEDEGISIARAQLAEVDKKKLDRPFLRDAFLAITSFASYHRLGIDAYYTTLVESHTEKGMNDAMDVVDQLLALIPDEEEGKGNEGSG